jgi:hypothetical protein
VDVEFAVLQGTQQLTVGGVEEVQSLHGWVGTQYC